MAYKVIILYQLYMPSYFLGTFTEYPYVYTVSHHQSNGNNATNIYNSAVKNGQEEDLLRSVDYLSQSPFVIDWDNENSTTINSAFYIIPIKYPDKFKRMGVFRYTSLTPAEDWW